MEKLINTEKNKKADNIMSILERESVFEMTNPDTIRNNILSAVSMNRQVRFGCFVCIPMDLEVQNGKPEYFVGEWKTRLERSKIVKRFENLMSALNNLGDGFVIDFCIADTDAYDIYGQWLKSFDQSSQLRIFEDKLRSLFKNSNFNIQYWSDLQASYEGEYNKNFSTVEGQILEYVDKEYLEASYKKRISFFEQRDIKIDEETSEIAFKTAVKNIALYAAQGPIIEKEFDCLIIADPDPVRMGRIQSLLAPKLGILYPVKE